MVEKENLSKREILGRKRRQEILDAAISVFAKKGFNGATTREIAAEAGIAEGTIFRYFKTKKDILISLASPHIVQSLADTLEEVSGESDEVVLTAILKNRLDIIIQNNDLVKLFFAEAQFHPELREKFTESIIIKAAGILENFIIRKIEMGEYKDIDPKIATRVFAGMFGVFILWSQFLLGDKFVSFKQDQIIENVVDIFLNGIRKQGTGGDEGHATE